MIRPPGHVVLSLLVCLVSLPAGVLAQPSTWLFESIPSRPLALSSDGTRLYAVNTPDSHLEIFDVSGAAPVRLASVPVGLEPVAVALRSDGEAWVVNQLSDSVSIVNVAVDPPRVVRTLLVADEPSDIVFAGPAGRRAFVTTARRGQNTLDPQGAFDTPGIGRAQVWVFDATALGDGLLPEPEVILDLFSDKPRALAATADGSTVYAAGFMTGNRTTTLNAGLVCAGNSACAALPPPRENAAGVLGPAVGLIVQFDASTGRWVDERGQDWSADVRFSLPDFDVFQVDADAAVPSVTGQLAGVGTVLFGMAVNPQSGLLYVSNTEARNRVRFEGPGDHVRANAIKPPGEPASVRGHLHEARVTVIDGDAVVARHLNPHLDYDARPQPASARALSLAQPLGMQVSGDGQLLYVAAFGSGVLAVLPTTALEGGTYEPSVDDQIALSAGGPTGLVLDEARGRAFVATRFDNGISTVSLASRSETGHIAMHTPESAEVYWGRPLLYDARISSSTGEASCGSCHVFGDLDGLAWDLGNPDGDVVVSNNPVGPIGSQQPFHPLKGPMTTQSLRGMATHGPLHWRGDRTAGDPLDERADFLQFNPAFDDLLGRDEGPIPPADMALFADFALRLAMPPNPIRNLDGSLRPDEQAGRAIYFDRGQVDVVATCNGCHVLDAASGFFGASGDTTFEGESQEFKVPHLRNLYQKVGMFGMPPAPFFLPGDNQDMGPQVRGFGFLHDGSTDTAFRFFRSVVFVGLDGDVERRQVEAFSMAFDSDLAPVVGQQVSAGEGAGPDVQGRVQLLAERAAAPFALAGAPGATECDLVAHGVVGGEARGFLRQADGRFTSDRAAEPSRSRDELLALAAGEPITFLCAPPGAGVRMALDRDEDGDRDRDELDRGESEIDRPIPPRPGSSDPDPGPDAGPPGEPDAGVRPGSPDPGPGESSASASCGGCSTGATGGGGAAWLILAGLLALGRGRTRSRPPTIASTRRASVR